MVPSRRTSRVVLWLVLLLTLPVPYYLGAFEVAPAVRLLFFSALILGVIATEGAEGYQGVFALLATVQSIVWPLVLLGVAWLGAGTLHRYVPERLRAGALIAAAAALVGFALFPIYSTELSSSGPASNLAQLLD